MGLFPLLGGAWVSVQSSRFLPMCELSPLSSWSWQDEQLRALVKQFGQQDWKFLASHFPVSAAPLLSAPPEQGAWERLGVREKKGEFLTKPHSSPNKTTFQPPEAISTQTGIRGALM